MFMVLCTFSHMRLRDAGSSIPETDCVLTSGEIHQLAESRGVDLAALPEAQLDSLLDASPHHQLHAWPGGSGMSLLG